MKGKGRVRGREAALAGPRRRREAGAPREVQRSTPTSSRSRARAGTSRRTPTTRRTRRSTGGWRSRCTRPKRSDDRPACRPRGRAAGAAGRGEGGPAPASASRCPRWQAWLLGVLPIAALLLAWSLVTRGARGGADRSRPRSCPRPSRSSARSALAVVRPRADAQPGRFSFVRVVAGFAAGAGCGLSAGRADGRLHQGEGAFTPLAIFGGYLPIPALVPLTLSLLRHGRAAEGDVPGARVRRSTWCRCWWRRLTPWTTRT